jgi:hypothetical protein
MRQKWNLTVPETDTVPASKPESGTPSDVVEVSVSQEPTESSTTSGEHVMTPSPRRSLRSRKAPDRLDL